MNTYDNITYSPLPETQSHSHKETTETKRGKCKFNKRFMELRNSLSMEKISRKCQFDSMLKKVKAKVFKVIHDSLSRCFINKYRLIRLPQAYITNIKIEFNKKILGTTVLDMYREYQIFNSFEELISEGAIKDNKKAVLERFLGLTFEEVYNYYITSLKYINDKEKIARKDGAGHSMLFKYIAQNFIQYYVDSKGNKPKKVKSVKITEKYIENEEKFEVFGNQPIITPKKLFFKVIPTY
jgi:hypothetical protein